MSLPDVGIESMYHHSEDEGRKCQRRAGEGIRFLGARVRVGCDLPGGYWEANPGSMEEQSVKLRTQLTD